MLGNSARMRRGIRLLATVLAAMALAGCGGGGVAETTDEPGEVSFDLAAVGDSNVAGARAVLSYLDADRTRILVDGIGEQSGGGANPVQLRRGSCDEPGEVVLTLPRLQGSSTETEVQLGMVELFEGDYAVVVELAGGAKPIACGNVPDESTG
jgi:hypothetical protein